MKKFYLLSYCTFLFFSCDDGNEELGNTIANTKPFLEIHNNTVWKLSEVEEFGEYIFFYNSEIEFLKTVIQSVDASYVECNSVKGEIVRNFGPALIVDIPITNPPYGNNRVSFSYFEDEDYIGRTEGNYQDRYDRVGGISYSEICD